jgi:hypothetical protein
MLCIPLCLYSMEKTDIMHNYHLANKSCVDGTIDNFLHMVVTFPPCMMQILITFQYQLPIK